MGNMARDRCRCSGGGAASRRSLIFAILLAFDLLLASAVVAADVPQSNDASRFEYQSLSDDLSELNSELHFQLGPDSKTFRTLDRRRRMAVEPEARPVVNQNQPTKQPATAASSQPAVDAVPPVIAIKTNASMTAPYTTTEGNGTTLPTAEVVSNAAANSATTQPSTSAASSSAQPPATNAGKNGVVVSTPIVPSTDKNATSKANSTAPTVPAATPSPADKEKPHVKVWANQTMWSNVTGSKAHAEGVGEDVDDDFTIDKYPTELTNKTLHDNNVTKSEEDTHQYYNSTFSIDEKIGRQYWVDLNNHPDLQVNTLLSRSHRRAATIKLKFNFPFYGHKVRNITIATGGFLYTGEYVHSWLAATQYIAPLMANFDTTLSPKSFVKYADNGTAFTVEWENVHLQDKSEAGPFTFQVTLLQNGDIIFVYAKIPVLVESIEDKEHPVKIGLSDAYMMDRTVFFARRKTIYEYHRVNFNRQDIRNWTVIYLKALPTCLQLDNCNDCLTKIKEFDCKWCPELQKCSTGTFRFRQDWLQKGCDIRYVKEEAKCPARTSSYHEHVDARAEDHHADDMPEVSNYSPSQQAVGPASSSLEHSESNMNMGVSGIIGILFLVSLIAGLGAWAAYAYRNPHSASGQMLIRYRPSQWSWRRGEARYTAATIHM